MRRRAASLSTPHRGSDVNVDPLRSAILFRDARGVSISRKFVYIYKQRMSNIFNDDIPQLLIKFLNFNSIS